MLRNRTLRRQVIACAMLGATLTLAAWASGDWAGAGEGTALWVAATALVISAVCAVGEALRYRATARLAERVERALSGERVVGFQDMDEGDLAILANETGKALQRLQVANEQLDQERVALADALADISHQLRTPLTSLGLELELMRKGANEADQRARARDAERLLGSVQWLVTALLRMARVDAGVVRMTSQQVDVARLVADAAAPLAIPLELAGVTLETRVEPGAAFTGDAAWTREALSNVLKNCLEHTPSGGTVRVTAAEDVLATRIRVEDTGPGIAEEDLPHVFERFYRGRGATDPDATNPTGVGIGLSLARSLVAAQGGALTAGNARDASGAVTGARFDLTFFKVVV